MPPQEGDSAYSFDEMIVALFWGACASVATFGLIVLISIPIGSAVAGIGARTDEGGAWFGIGLGVPCGIVSALVVFYLVVRYKLKHRRLP